MRYRAMDANYPSYQIGTGEHCVLTPRGTRVTLNNTFLAKDECRALLTKLCSKVGIPEPVLDFGSKSVSRWGTAYYPGSHAGTKRRYRSFTGADGRRYWTASNRKPPKQYPDGRILLYRRSVKVLLHELAHIMTPRQYHTAAFGQVMDKLVGVYFEIATETTED